MYKTQQNLISKSMLSTEHCTVPALVTHKISGVVGWYPTAGSTQLAAELGGGFEFAPGNVAVEQFEVSVKLGIRF